VGRHEVGRRVLIMTSMVQGRGQAHDVKVGFDDDGELQALRVRVTQDLGARPTWASGCPLIGFMSGDC
jgi:CO/xanthine dehydrogenase Mo-binding subunit